VAYRHAASNLPPPTVRSPSRRRRSQKGTRSEHRALRPKPLLIALRLPAGVMRFAMRAATAQTLTVSSQIKNPISVGGRILDVFMEIYAITVIATLAGALGSFLQKRGQEIDDKR
jgi:hypothetical protein